MIGPLILFAALAVPSAQATIVTTTATAQADNVLRYNFRVVTTEVARVAIQVWPQGGAVTSGWTSDYTTANTKTSNVTVWNFKPGTRYNYKVLVDPAIGANYSSGPRTFTTAALPANLAPLTVTTHTGAPDFQYLMIDTRTTDTALAGLIIADTTGVVRWYQLLTDPNAIFNAVYYSSEEEAVYAIVSSSNLVRYDMDGTKSLDWDFGDHLQDYVHHEVRVHDGVIYVLAGRTFTQGTNTYVEDGIQGYDAAGNLVYEWWASETGGLNPLRNAPQAWQLPGVGFWASEFPTAIDWLHANSLDIVDEGGSLKAYVSLRWLSQVAKVDMGTGAVEWLAGHANSRAVETNGDFTMSTSGVSTRWWVGQHSAFVRDDGVLSLFDNGNGVTMSRSLVVDVDPSTWELRIDRSVDLSGVVTNAFEGVCDDFSATFLTDGDHLVMSCSTSSRVADFDATGAVTWDAQIGGSYAQYRATPLDSIGY
jgi:hypothetical protein